MQIGSQELAGVANASAAVIGQVRRNAFTPEGEKRSPVFTGAELLEILGNPDTYNAGWLEYRVQRGVEPMPERKGSGSKRVYTLAGVREWARRERKLKMKPVGAAAAVLCVSNFKGGSCKTTTAVTLAQGLSTRGHKVLLIDADPQASLSHLFGVLPDIDNPATIAQVCNGQLSSVDSLIRPTYWDGIDLIAASNLLSEAETALPGQHEYWLALDRALEGARAAYDVVIIDTSPTLSPLAATCVMASNGLIVPVTPNALDFASSVQFFGMLADTCKGFEAFGNYSKTFDFVNVLLSKVDSADRATVGMVREMMQAAYGRLLLSVEIPKTTATTSSSAAFGTIYDENRFGLSRGAYARAKGFYDEFVSEIEQRVCDAWARNKGVSKQ